MVAPALRAASKIVADHAARVASSLEHLIGSSEISGVAAAAMHVALDEYCAACDQRLSSASAALTVASGAFAATDETNSAALASVRSVHLL
ncbi:hypothetical protein BST12_15380 [Mycobacterium angelicum]|uniref:Uncharacterized protein n=1 Tax=Mycobacterium angelicum TaxID=470074 RepID=A0A1W9ZR56_MYCAN|nr:hypothetical protein BST12_15380 [Mycobacterium angelicum]